MVRRRSVMALGAFTSSLMVAATVALGAGLSSRAASLPVSIVASTPTTWLPAGPPPAVAAPTTVTGPPTTGAPSTTPPASARTTLPPTPSAPRPPTRPAPPSVTVTAARRPVPVPVPVVAPPSPSGPRGDAADYALIGYRWDPCQPITVSSSGPDVSAVVAELAGITGLTFQMVDSGGQISVAWGATPAGGEVGQTDWRSVGPWMVSATVTLNQSGVIYLPTVLRHEFGHAVGLNHSGQPNEIMYGIVGPGSPAAYQAGDLAGLRAVGASAGC